MLPPANAIHHIPIHLHTRSLDLINEIKTYLLCFFCFGFFFFIETRALQFQFVIYPIEIVENHTQVNNWMKVIFIMFLNNSIALQSTTTLLYIHKTF